MAGADNDYVELFSELHVKTCSSSARSFPFAQFAPGQDFGAAPASLTPRKRLNFASGMAGADNDYVEMFSERRHL